VGVAGGFAAWGLARQNEPGERSVIAKPNVIAIGPIAPTSVVTGGPAAGEGERFPETTAAPADLPASSDPASDARLRALLAMIATADADTSVATVPAPVASPEPRAAPAAFGMRRAGGPAHVVVYTTSWCPACREAKAWMRANGVPYEDRDIESNRTYARQMRALNPRMSIPTFDVDGDVSVGFSSSWLVAMLQKHGGTAAR
jgi:glutaredoxin